MEALLLMAARLKLTDIDNTFVVIDSELEEAYFIEGGVLLNANNNMAGVFPILDVGNNIVTFNGE